MKAQTKLMGLMISGLLFAGSIALADSPAAKENVRIDFNKMIDANASDKNDLEKTVNTKMANKSNAKSEQAQLDAADADKKKVVDFVDVEINMNKERPLVDRRFNSVGEPRIATEFNVKLVAKK